MPFASILCIRNYYSYPDISNYDNYALYIFSYTNIVALADNVQYGTVPNHSQWNAIWLVDSRRLKAKRTRKSFICLEICKCQYLEDLVSFRLNRFK